MGDGCDATDSLAQVRYHAFPPAANLIAEEARTAKEPEPNWAVTDNAVLAVTAAPCRRHLDGVPHVAKPDLKCGVVQILWLAPGAPSHDPFVEAAAPADDRQRRASP